LYIRLLSQLCRVTAIIALIPTWNFDIFLGYLLEIMQFITFLVALFVASVTGAVTPAPKCGKGVHIIVARESEAAPGPGLIGTAAERVIELIPGSDMESVDYPALLDPYIVSETAGVANMTKLITTFAKKCPKTKIVLMGYSQVSLKTPPCSI
jgi:hypothetical protein